MGVQAEGTRVDLSPFVAFCLLTGFSLLVLLKAFDFNHMNNVLISRDCRKARLIDIDGNSKGSIQPPTWLISALKNRFLTFVNGCSHVDGN